MNNTKNKMVLEKKKSTKHVKGNVPRKVIQLFKCMQYKKDCKKDTDLRLQFKLFSYIQ